MSMTEWEKNERKKKNNAINKKEGKKARKDAEKKTFNGDPRNWIGEEFKEARNNNLVNILLSILHRASVIVNCLTTI